MEFSKGIMFCIFILAFAVSLITTPVAMKIAPKIGAMDIPKDGRKLHKKAIPRFGGMGIFLGTMTSTIFFLWGSPKIIGVVLGGTLIYILGVVDDLKDLPAAVKFTKERYLYDYVRRFAKWKEFKLTCMAKIDGKCTPTPFNFTTIDAYYSENDANRLKKRIKKVFGDQETAT